MGRSGEDKYDLSGDAIGWGLNLSSNIKLGKNDVVRAFSLFMVKEFKTI